MEKLWILVAQRSEAAVFERKSGDRLELVKKLENPEGRLQDQELAADRPGSTFRSVGTQRHDHSAPTSPSEQVTINFSKEIARCLDEARHLTRFSSLILIASPEILGLLRQDMAKATCDLVIETVDKNLGNLNETEVQGYLRNVVSNVITNRSNQKTA